MIKELGQSYEEEVLVLVSPSKKLKMSDMYLFQEVRKPELGFPNHKFIQLWTGQVPVGHESFQ